MGLIKDRLRNFMQGRYGVDALSNVLIISAFICLFLSFFFWRGFNLLGAGLVVCAYFRILSTNYEKRYRENRAFLNIKNRVFAFFRNQKNMMRQRKTHHIYTCSKCKQKIRIPKGHGKILITCPKCKFEFRKKS